MADDFNSGGARVRRAVELGSFTSRDRVDALARAGRGIRAAAKIVGVPDANPLAVLTEGIVEQILSGEAKNGMTLEALCENRQSAGHIRDHLTDELAYVGDLAVRLIQAEQERPVLHEQLFSTPTPPGRDTQALGCDKNPKAGNAQHTIGFAVGAGDRSVPATTAALLKGTRDDCTCDRADLARIAGLEAELRQPLPATLAEQVEELIRTERSSRSLLIESLTKNPDVVAGLGLDGARLRKHYFPRCLFADEMPYGAPITRGRASFGSLFPGDDDALADVLAGAGRYGVLRATCEDRSTAGGLSRGEIVELIAARFDDEPVDIPPEHLDAINRWGPAQQLGVLVPWGVRYWWLRRAQRLIRLAEVSDDHKTYFTTQVWRWFGESVSLPAAIVLAERSAQPWVKRCLQRWREDCAPAKIHPHKARVRNGLMALGLPANAATVATDRARQVRPA